MSALALSVVAHLALNLCRLLLRTRGNKSAGAYGGGALGWLMGIPQVQQLEPSTPPEPRRIERSFCLMEVVGIESEGGILLSQSEGRACRWDSGDLIDQSPKAVGR